MSKGATKNVFNPAAQKTPQVNGVYEWSGRAEGFDYIRPGHWHVEMADNKESWQAMWENIGQPVPGDLPKNVVAILVVGAQETSNPTQIVPVQISRAFHASPDGKPFNNENRPSVELVFKQNKIKAATPVKVPSSPWHIHLVNGPVSGVFANRNWAQDSIRFHKKTVLV